MRPSALWPLEPRRRRLTHSYGVRSVMPFVQSRVWWVFLFVLCGSVDRAHSEKCYSTHYSTDYCVRIIYAAHQFLTSALLRARLFQP